MNATMQEINANVAVPNKALTLTALFLSAMELFLRLCKSDECTPKEMYTRNRNGNNMIITSKDIPINI